jgi:hypothetical protein
MAEATVKTGVPFSPHRSHGTIHPAEPRTAFDGSTVAASYEQFGLDRVNRMYGPAPDYKRILLDGQELEDVAANKAAVKAKAAQKAAADTVKAAGRKAEAPKPKPTGRFAQMTGGDHTVDTADAKAEGPTLEGWAKGDAEIPFAEVKRRIKAEYDVDIADEDDAVEVLVSNGVLTKDEVMVGVAPE